jgi:5-methylcytosine-specific restriction endonuclease McrA
MAWDRPRKLAFPPAVRRAILKRDKWCAHCGERRATQADHIKPVAEGGGNTIENGQGLCDPCHDAKTAAEARRGYRRWNTEKRPMQRHPGERHPGILD